MSNDIIDQLDPAFAAKVRAALAELKTRGMIFQPYFGKRDPVTQAKLWRQSKSTVAIDAYVTMLRGFHCDFLADCILKAGPQTGPHVTDAPPGLSWHQYGLAVDCVHLDGSKADWGSSSYWAYSDIAKKFGMTSGEGWHDVDHWQDTSQSSPLSRMILPEINAKMKELWPDVLA